MKKKNFNSDGQQFHQYQHNEQQPLSFKPLNTEKTTAYGVGNPCPCLGQTQKYGEHISVNGIP
jgi:hypothetical protein